jgi:PhnB protein
MGRWASTNESRKQEVTSSIKPVPEGYHSITPYLAVEDAARAIEFYKAAFGAVEVMRLGAPGGKVGHAEIEIGGSRIMLAMSIPRWAFAAPKPTGAPPSTCTSTSPRSTPWRARR